MAVNNNDVEIKISTELDDKGTKEAVAGLSALEKEARASMAAFNEIDKSATAAAGGVKKLEIGHHELRAILSLLPAELGPVGELAHLAFNPALVAIGGLTLAFEMLDKQIKAVGETLRATADWAKESARIQIDSQNDVRRSIEQADADYNRHIAHVLDGEDRVKTAMEQRIQMFGSEADAQRDLASAEDKRMEEFVKFLVAQGKLTPEQGEDFSHRIKQSGEDRKERTEEGKMQREIEGKARTRALEKEKFNAQVDKPNEMRAANAPLQTQLKAIDGTIKQEQEKFAKMDADAKEAEDRWNELKWAGGVMKHGGSFADKVTASAIIGKEGATMQSPDEVKRAASGLRAAADTEQARIGHLTDQKASLETQQKDAEEAIKRVEEENDRLKKSISDLTDAIDAKAAELTQKKADYGASRAESLRTTVSEQFYAQAQRGEIGQAGMMAAGADNFNVGSMVSKVLQQAQNNVQLDQAHMGNGGAIHQTLEIIRGLLASAADIRAQDAAKLEDYNRRLGDIDRRLNSSGNVGH